MPCAFTRRFIERDLRARPPSTFSYLDRFMLRVQSGRQANSHSKFIPFLFPLERELAKGLDRALTLFSYVKLLDVLTHSSQLSDTVRFARSRPIASMLVERRLVNAVRSKYRTKKVTVLKETRQGTLKSMPRIYFIHDTLSLMSKPASWRVCLWPRARHVKTSVIVNGIRCCLQQSPASPSVSWSGSLTYATQ